MTAIGELMQQLQLDWSVPRAARHGGRLVPVPLTCTFSLPATETELSVATWATSVPQPLRDFWLTGNGASLFEDLEYGQWGLRVLSISEALEKTIRFTTDRSEDCRQGDVVIGSFLGDSDQLLIRCDPSNGDYGCVLIALPLDERSEWDLVAPSFEAFLIAYTDAHGDKFWRRSQQSH